MPGLKLTILALAMMVAAAVPAWAGPKDSDWSARVAAERASATAAAQAQRDARSALARGKLSIEQSQQEIAPARPRYYGGPKSPEW